MTVKLPVDTRFKSYLHACVLANMISESITGCVYVMVNSISETGRLQAFLALRQVCSMQAFRQKEKKATIL